MVAPNKLTRLLLRTAGWLKRLPWLVEAVGCSGRPKLTRLLLCTAGWFTRSVDWVGSVSMGSTNCCTQPAVNLGGLENQWIASAIGVWAVHTTVVHIILLLLLV